MIFYKLYLYLQKEKIEKWQTILKERFHKSSVQ